MPLFAITVFLSAFLLFQIQPIVAKMILPWFGGSSSVWSVCMVFFQGELLLGYAYVHWLHARLALRRQLLVHVLLLGLSLLLLPVAADPDWKGTALAHPSLNVLAVLMGAVGAPYLLLSSTGPLMQAWFARCASTAKGQVQPYRLYALSNLASMLALLSYPVLIEPYFVLSRQALAWSMGYCVFVLVCAGAAAFTWRRRPVVQSSSLAKPAIATAVPSWGDRLLWMGLAATASILLLALTRHMTQDVAPVPFLWVLPLSVYLLSFILCFDAPRFYLRPLFLVALPLALIVLDRVVEMVGMGAPSLVILLGLSLFIFCMVCHGELVRRKPALEHLTLFYLMISLGGAIGGLLVGLVAPVLFNAYFELPIGLFLMALLTVHILWREASLTRRFGVRTVQGVLLVCLLGYGARLMVLSAQYVEGYRVVVRNFYGQLRVGDEPDESGSLVRAMFHGRIVHGEEYLAAELVGKPTSYYCVGSGIERVFQGLPQNPGRKVGIVGLGAGTLAAYGRAGDEMRIYEINERVLELARQEFTFLERTPAQIVPVLGDGRLMLDREPAQGFDLLVLDAFSGDSIPTHLVTLEAMQIYLRHLKPDGVIALHITNTYLDLRPVMAAAAQALGRDALIDAFQPDANAPLCRHSEWVVLAKPGAAISAETGGQSWTKLLPKPGFRVWSDAYSNLLGILR
jgi:SAM-dependent methyltransferase